MRMKCEKCGFEFECTEQESKYMKLCKKCYAKEKQEELEPEENQKNTFIAKCCALKSSCELFKHKTAFNSEAVLKLANKFEDYLLKK